MNMQDTAGFSSATLGDLIGADAPRNKGKSNTKLKTPAAKKPIAKAKAPAKKISKSKVRTGGDANKPSTPLKVSTKGNAKGAVKTVSHPSKNDSLNFSEGRSFNKNDTKYRLRDGRIFIDQSEGVRVRCELAITGVLRAGSVGVSVPDLTADLNGSLTNQYSKMDIGYAVGRLHKAGLVNLRRGTGRYTATQKLYQAWKRVSGK